MSRWVKPHGVPSKARSRKRRKPAPARAQVLDVRYHNEDLSSMREDERAEIKAVLDRWRFD